MSIFEQDKKQHMRVLVACEESQRVCMEFRKLGHEAYSCDIEPCSGGHEEWHIQADVLPLLNGDCSFQTVDGIEHRIYGKWDMIIAFPPCTYLTVAGNRWFNVEKYGDKAIERERNREQGKQFFMQFVNADCDKIAIENPIGVMNTAYRKPDCIIQPWQFGDTARKSTCLWLKGLQKLKPTEIVNCGEIYSGGYSRNASANWAEKDGKILRWNDPETAKIRSKTFPGVAKAMAEQWGKVNTQHPQSQHKSAPRYSRKYYGISKGRYRQLKEYIRSGRYASLASSAAHTANKDIAEYILLSVKENLSYEGLQRLWDLKKIERMACGRSDFYGYQSLFYSLFDMELRRIGK